MPEPSHDENRTHVLFFTSELGGGGAEKHLVRVANHLDRSRFRVSVAVLRGGGSYEADLAGDVQLHPLGVRGLVQGVLPLSRLMRQERPDVVCSVMDHVNCLAIAATRILRNRPPVVACVQVATSMEWEREPSLRKRVLLRAMRYLYPSAARVVAISEGVRQDLQRFVLGIEERTIVIYNAGMDEAVEQLAVEPDVSLSRDLGVPLLVACGRLTEQKGFLHLLRALALVREHIPAELWVLGEGDQRAALETEVRRLGLERAVRLAGFQRNPYPYMREADVFVLSSLWEGFGNVVTEAMAVGTPVVATDCPHGPAEIIQHGESGLLVPPGDPRALAEAILRVLRDGALRQRLAEQGRKRSEAFTAPAIAEQYARVLLSACSQHATTGIRKSPPVRQPS